MEHKPKAAGKSSFDLIDTAKTFAMMDVAPGSIVLDLACGVGNYSTALAMRVGETGTVYAADLWKEGIEALNQKIVTLRITNIRTLVADITLPLPLADGTMDACLAATVLHDLPQNRLDATIQEVARLLKSGGMFNILEFKKIDNGPGPPIHMRMDQTELDALVGRFGFIKVADGDVGPFTYLAKYKKTGS